MPTQFQDISAMGRLTGVPHFFTGGAHQEEKNVVANLRRARKDKASQYSADFLRLSYTDNSCFFIE